MPTNDAESSFGAAFAAATRLPASRLAPGVFPGVAIVGTPAVLAGAVGGAVVVVVGGTFAGVGCTGGAPV
jgi:hypothetical protein